MGERVAKFNTGILADMIVEGWRAGYPNEVIECIKGVPADTVYTGRNWVEPIVGGGMALCMVFEHPDWPEPKPGESNELSIVFQRKMIEVQP